MASPLSGKLLPSITQRLSLCQLLTGTKKLMIATSPIANSNGLNATPIALTAYFPAWLNHALDPTDYQFPLLPTPNPPGLLTTMHFPIMLSATTQFNQLTTFIAGFMKSPAFLSTLTDAQLLFAALLTIPMFMAAQTSIPLTMFPALMLPT